MPKTFLDPNPHVSILDEPALKLAEPWRWPSV
jgi:hypothetical protein